MKMSVQEKMAELEGRVARLERAAWPPSQTTTTTTTTVETDASLFESKEWKGLWNSFDETMRHVGDVMKRAVRK